MYSNEEWRALYPNLPHWIFRLDTVTHHNLEPDELYIIWLGTAIDNMSNVWSQIAQCYSDMRSSGQYTNLSLSSFCDPKKPNGNYPKLKGKGAEVKSLASVLCKVWSTNMQGGNHEHALIAQALESQHAFQCIIDDYADDLFFPHEEAIDFQQHVIDFLTAYSALCHIADARGDLLWNMTTKFHWLYHIGQRAHVLCPCRGACWIDEDYVNKCKEVAQACAAGTPLHTIPPKMVDKMRWGLNLMHEDLDD